MVRAGVRVIERMLALPRPIVTVCTGHAYPMGAFLMLCADVRFGVPGDWNIGMNEVAIGLAVPQFAVELARIDSRRQVPCGLQRGRCSSQRRQHGWGTWITSSVSRTWMQPSARRCSVSGSST